MNAGNLQVCLMLASALVLAGASPRKEVRHSFTCSESGSGFYCHWDSSAPQGQTYYYVQCNSAGSMPAVTEMSCPAGLVCKGGEGSVHCDWPSSGGDGGSSSTKTPVVTAPPPVPQSIPGGLSRQQTPMLVYFSIDDALTSEVYRWSMELFRSNHKNPNNCSVSATFNVIEENTVFNDVRSLYDDGFEIASHSKSHRVPTTWWEEATKDQWKDEIEGMRDILADRARIDPAEVRGMRSPFLALGGRNQFDMLYENNFTYDATMVTRGEPLWPFRLLTSMQGSDNCTQHTGCPGRPYPDIWEVPLNTLRNCSGNDDIGLSMVDACRPETRAQALAYLRHNFYRHYNHAVRPPFGLNMHFAWFHYPTYDHNFIAMKEFIREILGLGDVWIVSSYNVLQWIQSPTSHADMMNGLFPPVNC